MPKQPGTPRLMSEVILKNQIFFFGEKKGKLKSQYLINERWVETKNVDVKVTIRLELLPIL